MSSPQDSPPDGNEIDMMDQTPDSPPELSNQSLPNTQNQGASSSRANTSSNGATGNGNSSSGDKVSHGTPGSSWNNKKYKEEYETAFSRLCHQEYEPGKYGDPLM